VILLGDKDQLPSVEAGSVLADMSPEAGSAFARHVVVLANVYRSAGKLLDLAQAINIGHPIPLQPMDFNQALTLNAGGWAFVATGEGTTMNRHLDRWVTHQYVQTKGRRLELRGSGDPTWQIVGLAGNHRGGGTVR
jgi:exodeoxyribonuclease V alpha subunit